MFKNRKRKGKRALEKKKEINLKLIITFGLIVLFRALSFVPVPFVKAELWSEVSNYSFITFVDVFSGGVNSLTFMAIGVSAYITSSIIIQMITFVYGPLSEMSKTPSGQKLIKRYTIMGSILIAGISSTVILKGLDNQAEILSSTKWYVYMTIVGFHIMGTLLSVFIGETITEKGFGNGVSILIAINIIAGFPNMITRIVLAYTSKGIGTKAVLLGLGLTLFLLIATVLVESSERNLKVQYAKAAIRGNNRKLGGPNITASNFPIKLNLNGVMPLIMATAFIQLFVMVVTPFMSNSKTLVVIVTQLTNQTVPYFITVSALIFASSFMYSFLSFDARDIADNLQKNGGIILGVQPGAETVGYLRKINFNLTFWSSLFLALISLVPMLLFDKIGIQGVAATSFMIITGVALELWNELRNERRMIR